MGRGASLGTMQTQAEGGNDKAKTRSGKARARDPARTRPARLGQRSEDEKEEEPEEAQEATPAHDFRAPTKAEYEKYIRTHMPSCAWCPSCITGSGLSSQHWMLPPSKNRPRYHQQSNGLAECCVTVRSALENRIWGSIPEDDPILTWLVRHAALSPQSLARRPERPPRHGTSRAWQSRTSGRPIRCWPFAEPHSGPTRNTMVQVFTYASPTRETHMKYHHRRPTHRRWYGAFHMRRNDIAQHGHTTGRKGCIALGRRTP